MKKLRVVAGAGFLILAVQLVHGQERPQPPRLNWDDDVQGTDTPGLDQGHLFLWNAPTFYDAKATLRVDRHARYPGGKAGDVTSGFWVNCSVSSGVTNFEWCSRVFLDNHAAAGQNLGFNAVAQRYAFSGPTWTTNFLCQQLDGLPDPHGSCVGTEYDIVGNGTDKFKQRVGLQMVVARPPTGGAPAHAFSAFWTTPEKGAVWDNILVADGSEGSYGNGIDLSKATFSGAAIVLGPNQKLAVGATSLSGIGRHLSYSDEYLSYNTPAGAVLKIADDGGMVVGSSASSDAGLSIVSSGSSCKHQPRLTAESVTCEADVGDGVLVADAPAVLDEMMAVRVVSFQEKNTNGRTMGVLPEDLRRSQSPFFLKDGRGNNFVQQPSVWFLIKALQEQQSEIRRLSLFNYILAATMAAAAILLLNRLRF